MKHRRPPPSLEREILVEALRKGQTVRLRATTTSMWPTIRPGDLLLLRGEPIRPGDIAAVFALDALLTHRVEGRVGDRILLRGDARGAGTHAVGPFQILGRVVAIRRDLRAWRRYLAFRLRRWLRGSWRALAP